jgi:hypothetical protein
VLEELEAAKVRTFRTDINGATCFRLDGKTTRPHPFRAFCGMDLHFIAAWNLAQTRQTASFEPFHQVHRA